MDYVEPPQYLFSVKHSCGCEGVYYSHFITPHPERCMILALGECADCLADWHSSTATAYTAMFQQYLDYGVPIADLD